MSTQQRIAAVHELASQLVASSDGPKYTNIKPFWPLNIPRVGKVTLYQAAEAAGLSKTDVDAAKVEVAKYYDNKTQQLKSKLRIPVSVLPVSNGKTAQPRLVKTPAQVFVARITK